MLIRTEAPADILPTDALLKSVFDTDAEANLVMKLRENSRRTLSLVACNDDGEIVGHVMFSPVTVAGVDNNWQGLAPLAVKKEYQGQGIGSRLIEEGLSSLREFGYPVCVVLGDPDYYSRLGFSAAKDVGLNCQWDVREGAFQVQFLTAEIDTNRHAKGSALVEYSAEFSEL
ncbi:N-acetyltransferase [Vibrio sp. ZSDZ34]|jgi:putative acetyltransferase|uniref:N-acetyltransferase n=1 Tax=Vibrio gelatinilyticus TaxID=2893468 RepID=A0A9X1W981_9VIBR|nr:N-acetyltransferase [Vibrio gelatinilyticus]MCJ2375816.1 N-acetyltransferase [Vibrio gelatinilyticus]